MLTPKQKKQLRVLINKNPDVDYQEKLDDEQYALKELKKFCEREIVVLKRQIDTADLSLKILSEEQKKLAEEESKLKNQEQQLEKQKQQLLKQIELLSEK